MLLPKFVFLFPESNVELEYAQVDVGFTMEIASSETLGHFVHFESD